jgi:hypothetical protein
MVSSPKAEKSDVDRKIDEEVSRLEKQIQDISATCQLLQETKSADYSRISNSA